MNNLGEEIKQARKNLNMTQKTLAMLLGVQTQTVWRWEKRDREQNLKTIYKIAELLKAQQLTDFLNRMTVTDQLVSLGLGYLGTVLDNIHKLMEAGNTREISLVYLVYILLKSGCEDLAKTITPEDNNTREKSRVDIRQNNYGGDTIVNAGTASAGTLL